MKKNRALTVAESRYKSMDTNRKLRKKSDNITAKRVTLLPGFLSRGVKSQTVYKTDPVESPDYNNEVLNENLHGLLNGANPRQVRRSNRLLSKKKGGETTASNYFLEVVSSQPSPITRSKSIFKEIKTKYALSLQKNHDFADRIFKQLTPNFVLNEPNFYKSKICDEIRVIDKILSGELDPITMSINRKRQYNEEDKENYPLKFPYVPQSKWVFQTPPNRKLNFSNVRMEDNCIKPAILENRNDATTVVYEMNKKINVDLSNYTNKQQINIDNRYMVKVANLPNNSNNFTFQCPTDEEDEVEEKKFESDPYELENHFLSLTCRPKKVPVAVSRIPSLKRKRDIFEPEPGCSTDLEGVNELESNFSFINNLTNMEESFTFQFTANTGSTTGHLFDFDGNKKDTFNFRY